LTSILSFIVFFVWSVDVKQKWWIPTSSGKRNSSMSGYCLYMYLFVYRTTFMIWTFYHFIIWPHANISLILLKRSWSLHYELNFKMVWNYFLLLTLTVVNFIYFLLVLVVVPVKSSWFSVFSP